MKRILIILFISVVMLSLCYSIGNFMNRSYIKEPTSGPAIEANNMPNAALLVIDIQNGYLNNKMLSDHPDFIFNTNRAIDHFRSLKKEVVFITMVKEKHSIGSLFNSGIAVKGTKAAEIVSTIHCGDHPVSFTKLRHDAFSNPDLQNYLNQKGIGKLYITGMVAEFCVKATIRGALNRGYLVDAVSDGILAERGAESKQKELQAYTGFGAKIISIEKLMAIN